MTPSRRTLLVSIAGAFALGSSPGIADSALPPGLDTDADGTVDLAEAKKAAEALFDKLDRDHDGTLDAKELRGRLSKGNFEAADPDKDGTISKEEYLVLVERRFKVADRDGDGTLTAKELHTGEQ
jgi:Ca2+-binding EF-hand superfamily protein